MLVCLLSVLIHVAGRSLNFEQVFDIPPAIANKFEKKKNNFEENILPIKKS